MREEVVASLVFRPFSIHLSVWYNVKLGKLDVEHEVIVLVLQMLCTCDFTAQLKLWLAHWLVFEKFPGCVVATCEFSILS